VTTGREEKKGNRTKKKPLKTVSWGVVQPGGQVVKRVPENKSVVENSPKNE